MFKLTHARDLLILIRETAKILPLGSNLTNPLSATWSVLIRISISSGVALYININNPDKLNDKLNKFQSVS